MPEPSRWVDARLRVARPVVGRLAPSPTGGLHLGHARTFLIAWLAARQAQGRIILRIEDLDASRVRAEAAEMALTDLKWLGLDWDEGPYVQSERGELYDQALKGLKAADHVYPCTCTRADIARAASAPHAEDEGPTYPGTCAHRASAVRLAVPGAGGTCLLERSFSRPGRDGAPPAGR